MSAHPTLKAVDPESVALRDQLAWLSSQEIERQRNESLEELALLTQEVWSERIRVMTRAQLLSSGSLWKVTETLTPQLWAWCLQARPDWPAQPRGGLQSPASWMVVLAASHAQATETALETGGQSRIGCPNCGGGELINRTHGPVWQPYSRSDQLKNEWSFTRQVSCKKCQLTMVAPGFRIWSRD